MIPSATPLTLLTLTLLPLTTLTTPISEFSNSIDRNKNANLKVSVYPTSNCKAIDNGIYFDLDLAYGIPIAAEVKSYKLSRDMKLPQERLDFSMPNKDNKNVGSINPQCGQWLETVNPDSNGNALKGGVCYTLKGGATAQCINLWKMTE